MTLRINHVLAIKKGEKSRSYAELTDLHKKSQKGDLYNGFSKVYRKTDEEGEDYPAQSQAVRLQSPEVVAGITLALTELVNIEFTIDKANQEATADVVVGGQVIIEGAPATFLLFLEKQLSDLNTFVQKLPTLDGSESWTLDPNTGFYRTEKISKHKTKKVPKVIVKYEATVELQAQTELIYLDETLGYWDTVKQSGALTIPRKVELLLRIDTLTKAVKQARVEANNTSCEKAQVADAIFGYLFA